MFLFRIFRFPSVRGFIIMANMNKYNSNIITSRSMKLVELALRKSWGTYPSLDHKLKTVNPGKLDVNNKGGDSNYYDNIKVVPSNHDDQVDRKRKQQRDPAEDEDEVIYRV